MFTRVFAEQMKRPELHLGDLAVEVRERVAELALKATDGSGQPAPHEQTPAYYDQTLGGRIYLAGRPPATTRAGARHRAGGSRGEAAGGRTRAASAAAGFAGRKLRAQGL